MPVLIRYYIARQDLANVAPLAQAHAEAAQEDDEVDARGFEGRDGGLHVVGDAVGEVDECALCAGLMRCGADGVGLREVGLDPGEASFFFLFRAEAGDGFEGVAHRENDFRSVLLGAAGRGGGDAAGRAEDDGGWGGHFGDL